MSTSETILRKFGGDDIKKIPLEATEKDIRTDADSFNKKTRQKHMFNEIHHSFKNYHAIEAAFSTGRARDIANIPKATGNKAILIIGSGPSLTKCLPTLKEWKGEIMVSTSQASTCVYWGKEPDYIVALDPDSHWDEIIVDTWEGRNSTLLLHPGVSWELVSTWPLRMGLFRKLEPQTPFYGNTQKVGYSMIKRFFNTANQLMQIHVTPMINTEIVMLGCVLNAQIFLAELMGYKNIYLLGADMGFPGGVSRFDKWEFKKTHWAESKSNMINTDSPLIIEAENGCHTEFMMLFYKKNFMSAWRLQRQNVISCSEGILYEVPYAKWEDVLAQQGKPGGKVKGINRAEAILRSETYMALHNTYVIHFSNGIQFTEFAEGLDGIKMYFKKLKDVGMKDISWNKTLKGLKKVARTGKLKKEDTEKILSWKYIKEDIPKPGEAQEKPSIGVSMQKIPDPDIKRISTDQTVHDIAPADRKYGSRKSGISDEADSDMIKLDEEQQALRKIDKARENGLNIIIYKEPVYLMKWHT